MTVKITDLPELTTPALDDWLYIVDKSDITDSPAGTSKKVKPKSLVNLQNFSSVAAFNSFGGAVVYGEGPLWIAGQQYWCDGSTYTSVGGATSAVQTFRDVPILVCTFGDSTANVGSANISQVLPTASFPASGATTINKFDSAKYALDFFYPLCRLIGNGGISGETTAQMLSRDGLGASASRKAITDVLTLNPDLILFRGGSINDITGITAGQVASQVITTVTNHKKLLGRLLSGGAKVIDSGIFGYSGTPTDLTATRSALLQINAQLKAYCATLDNVEFIDWTGILCDSTGAYLSGISTDGTHLNDNGAKIHALHESIATRKLFGNSKPIQFVGTNLCTNQMFISESAGNATGVVFGGSNVTFSNKSIESIKGIIFNTVTATPAGVAFIQIKLPFNATTAGIVANNKYAAEVDIFLEMIGGIDIPTFSSLKARIDLYKNAAGRIVYDSLLLSAAGGKYESSRIVHGVLGPFEITEASASLTASSYFSVEMGTDTSTVPFKIGVGNPRFVPIA